MTTKISSREVLTYLNSLGYNNISTQQLKEFMEDLKKLIKYEERKKIDNDRMQARSSLIKNYNNPADSQPNKVDIFSALHAQATVESKIKAVTKKGSVIAVQIKRTRSDACVHNKENQRDSNKSDSINKLSPRKKPLQEVRTNDIQEDISKDNVTSKKKFTKNEKSRPKASFIRPAFNKPTKSDPVALYQYYQEEWKTQKIPGQDSRSELRWAIREKMMCGPKVTFKC